MIKKWTAMMIVSFMLFGLTGFTAFAQDEADLLETDHYLKMNIKDNKSFSNVVQVILGTATGLENRNAHFYILMDVSGSTHANEVSHYFGRFYHFLSKSFFVAGDTITYLPFARHANVEDMFTFDFSPTVDPLLPSGSLTKELGTDVFEPVEKILQMIKEEGRKKEEPLVIFLLSDRTDNDKYESNAATTPSLYYPSSIEEWIGLREMLHRDRVSLSFWLDRDDSEKTVNTAFYLKVFYPDNLLDFTPSEKQIVREKDSGTNTMLSAVERDYDVDFFMQDDGSAIGYNLYISNNRDSLEQALRDPSLAKNRTLDDVLYRENIPAVDYKNTAGRKLYSVNKKELLEQFADAEREPLYYAVRAVDELLGESESLLIRELTPISVTIDVKSFVWLSAIIFLFIGAAIALAGKTGHKILFDGEEYTVGAKRPLPVLCSADSTGGYEICVSSYPPSFDGQTIGYVCGGPRFLPRLFHYRPEVRSASKEYRVDGSSRTLSKDTMSTVTISNRENESVDMQMEYLGPTKNVMASWAAVGLFLLISVIFILLGLRM